MATLSPIASLQELKLTFHETTLVFPSQKTQRESLFLSNIDHCYTTITQTAHFFKPNSDFPPENVARRLKMALGKVLVPYHFMAGRLRLNHQLGRLELDCNAAGAGFVVASSKLSLDEIRDGLAHPNLGFQGLAAQNLDTLFGVERPLFVLQVTSFRCGSFVIGMSANHILFDGMGAKIFRENLATQAFHDKPLAVIPCNNRRLLAARSPPIVTFRHPEFVHLNVPISLPQVSGNIHEQLENRIFKFNVTQIAQLKDRAINATNARISSFAVVAALMWRCKAFSDNKECKSDKISTLTSVINIRKRVNPPLPLSYSGNAVLPVVVSATHKELENGPFGKVVELISKMDEGMTDEYAKSAVDWLELYRGTPRADFEIASWMRWGAEKVLYPWGKPIYSCPLKYRLKHSCFIFPHGTDEGIGALVTLPPDQMEKFEAHFNKFFAMLRAKY